MRMHPEDQSTLAASVPSEPKRTLGSEDITAVLVMTQRLRQSAFRADVKDDLTAAERLIESALKTMLFVEKMREVEDASAKASKTGP